MDVKRIEFDDAGIPESVTVRLRLPEAVAIAKVFGELSWSKFEDSHPNLSQEARIEVYDCLVGEFFNRFWDDGVEGAV